MAAAISFARGVPSLDIIDPDGLRGAADQAFTADPGAMTAYGSAIGYVPLREWIAERHQVAPEQVLVANGSMQTTRFCSMRWSPPTRP
jgi:2-aminoadipate transaminase